MEIESIRTEGLGDSTYVLIHDGIGIVVDPQRDFDRFAEILDDRGASLRFVLETHVHNDYLSGGREMANALDAELVMPAGAAPVFRHRPAFHHEDLAGDAFTVRPIHSPGHTPEHTSYLVIVDDRPVALFSGGSLLVGSAGRSDLLGEERAATLARLQYGSVNRLAALPENVGLYPTHGAGSFCTASGAGEATSTIGQEKKTNPVLAYSDEDAFVEGQLSSLVPYPSYYRYMGPANLTAVGRAPEFAAPIVTEEAFSDVESEVTVVDARPKRNFAAGHLRGSYAIELREDFGVWLGWVLSYNAPLVLVMNPDQDVEDALRQLARIGFDEVRGIIHDLPAWERELAEYPLVNAARFAEAVVAGEQILDARAPNEHEDGIIRGSTLVYAPEVVAETPSGLDSSRPVWVACETGYRASIASSALQSRGFQPVVLADSGVTEVLEELSNRGWGEYSTSHPDSG